MSDRNLTDADVEAISASIERRLVRKFYLDLGKGVWSFVWKSFVAGLILVAVYGAAKSGSVQFPPPSLPQ